MEEQSIVALKQAINNAIWMHGPRNLTLGEAGLIARDIYSMIAGGKDRKEIVRAREVVTCQA